MKPSSMALASRYITLAAAPSFPLALRLRSSSIAFTTASTTVNPWSASASNSTTRRHFSSTQSTMSSSSFFDAVKSRRTYYQLTHESTIPDSKIVELVKETVKHAPSSFNSQSTRTVVLLGDQHTKLWEEIVKPAVKAVAPPEAWASSEQRLNGFKNAYGTILFYEDPADIAKLQEQFALYADRFPQWSEHTNAIHQFILWTALEAEGLGANLQHYNPLIDQQISSTWGVDPKWVLKAQLVFGKPAGQPGDKSFKPIDERVLVHGAKN